MPRFVRMRAGQRLRKTVFPVRRLINSLLRSRIRDGGPPNGTYSEESAINGGEVEGRIISNASRLLDIPRESEIRKAGLGQEYHRDWKTMWTVRENVFLAAPSLPHADADGKICLEATYGRPHSWSDPVWSRNGKTAVRDLSGNFTSIISRWNDGSNYFHWFMDGLTHLFHLDSFPADCRILVPTDLPEFAKRSIELLGLSDRIVHTNNEDLRIERYWFAAPTMLSGCPDPTGVNWLTEKFLSGEQPEASRRIYVERNSATRSLTNAEETRKFFESQGWEVVDPGQLDFDAQLRLFREAEAVAGAHGAALTNLLWASPGTRILEFMPSRRRNGCYAGISRVKELDHEVLVAASDRSGDMSIPLSTVRSWMERLR